VHGGTFVRLRNRVGGGPKPSYPPGTMAAMKPTYDWQERLRERTDESLRRRAARAAEREAMRRRRAHGLVERNAARLARARRRARRTAKDVDTVTTRGGRPIRAFPTG